MSGIYKTPGVYVEEIPKFPPSIAPVETAIPAFIGYTEKAIKNTDSLLLKPTRIESIAEYEAFFGGGSPANVTVTLDGGNQFLKAETTAKLYLYDSLRMFYANGGGNCYIVSIGSYDNTPDKLDFFDGLEALEKEDEPTILLFPDASGLPSGDLYDVQVEALKQCAKLQDRVAVCDLKYSTDFKTDVQEFRDKSGINNLKYGAAYGPWINTSLQHLLLYRNISFVQAPSNLPVTLGSLTSDINIKSLIADLETVQTTIDGLDGEENTLSGGGPTDHKKFEDRLNVLLGNYRTAAGAASPTNASLQAPLQAITDFLWSIVDYVKTAETNAPNPADPAHLLKIKTDLELYRVNSGLTDKIFELAGYHVGLDANTSAPKIELLSAGTITDMETYLAITDFTDLHVPDFTSKYTAPGVLTDLDKANVAFSAVAGLSVSLMNAFRFYAQTLAEYESKLNQSLTESFGLYKQLVSKASEALNLLPPSGAIAGVYASVDRERGVWKAPANVSLNAVIGPAVKISHEQQAEYNVDVNAGKSINIIRSFTGKGTLVWGARTLAGNDNEWRYISVRRFFNFVEESVKKATEQFVFEPNDANTWVRVQAMIENFLNTLWRQGALQGIKPEHAFYVAVGLGKTMTPLDILEGRMIIEIGMAAVRPAEFIILRFSHKMAES